ncbi:DNA alkylation repair protein [Candidatus Izemoplasma sp. B36]|uniref:DNA alkylation repair protein n=1 Tax=Candidatus Izemoplasma sp. B36 TaxID=3242468 RepID=UPI003558F51B
MINELQKLHRRDMPIESSKYTKEYVKGQVDYYIGITVPELRKLSKMYYNVIDKPQLDELMSHKYHEYRLESLFILEQRMKKAKELSQQKEIIDYYLKNLKYVNNWDLVDASAYQLLGKYLYNIKNYLLLYKLSKSNDLWKKRISIVSTNYLIKNNIFNVTIDIVNNLLEDKHDLIHKANGWMLRNLGDKDKKLLTKYLFENYSKIPRTTLRYAIEHYEEPIRKAILKGDFSWK